MPTYDYLCRATGRVFEVRHSIDGKLRCWGELCKVIGIDPGDVAPDTPVERLISGANVVNSSVLKNPEGPSCAAASPCCGGVCGLN
jgi:hypothetical protein